MRPLISIFLLLLVIVISQGTHYYLENQYTEGMRRGGNQRYAAQQSRNNSGGRGRGRGRAKPKATVAGFHSSSGNAIIERYANTYKDLISFYRDGINQSITVETTADLEKLYTTIGNTIKANMTNVKKLQDGTVKPTSKNPKVIVSKQQAAKQEKLFDKESNRITVGTMIYFCTMIHKSLSPFYTYGKKTTYNCLQKKYPEIFTHDAVYTKMITIIEYCKYGVEMFAPLQLKRARIYIDYNNSDLMGICKYILFIISPSFGVGYDSADWIQNWNNVSLTK